MLHPHQQCGHRNSRERLRYSGLLFSLSSCPPSIALASSNHGGGDFAGRGRSAGYIVIERSEEHTSELQSLMRLSYAVFCLNKKKLRYKYTRSQTPVT